MTERTIRITKRFYDDHADRDLPTPRIVRTTKTHYDIDASDSALIGELKSDAEYYSNEIDTREFPELLGIVLSARATLRTLKRARF